jgi:hypothetical protein
VDMGSSHLSQISSPSHFGSLLLQATSPGSPLTSPSQACTVLASAPAQAGRHPALSYPRERPPLAYCRTPGGLVGLGCARALQFSPVSQSGALWFWCKGQSDRPGLTWFTGQNTSIHTPVGGPRCPSLPPPSRAHPLPALLPKCHQIKLSAAVHRFCRQFDGSKFLHLVKGHGSKHSSTSQLPLQCPLSEPSSL